METINAYEGAWTEGGVRPGQRRKTSFQSIKEVHRDLFDKLAMNGKEALNAADYERTMHLPVGRGRLACDENGDFDKKAYRPPYNPAMHPEYPKHVHSTITEGESFEVRNKDEEIAAIASGKWSLKPLEIKRRFRLTADQQMDSQLAQIEAERSARFHLEKQVEMLMAKKAEEATPAQVSTISDLLSHLQEERKQRKELEAKVNMLLAMQDGGDLPVSKGDEDDEEEEEAAVTTASTQRKKR